ncbi:Serine/threonine-protein kinase 36 [Homalodisca vitripennis]|nr:Serine/threonine-protein kinase 36 [Homalodisca vitripennis]
MPENANIVDNSVRPEVSSGVDWYKVLKYGNKTLQTRVCYLISLMARHCLSTLQSMWNPKLKDYIEVLAYDSVQKLRCAAEDVVEVLQELPFYDQKGSQERESVLVDS